MTTLLVSMSLDPTRPDEVRHHLTVEVPAWANRQPGFVRGSWCQSVDGASGFGFVEFADTESAEAAASGPRGYQANPARPWNITGVELLETISQVG